MSFTQVSGRRNYNGFSNTLYVLDLDVLLVDVNSQAPLSMCQVHAWQNFRDQRE